jgi:hypothetical protein
MANEGLVLQHRRILERPVDVQNRAVNAVEQQRRVGE